MKNPFNKLFPKKRVSFNQDGTPMKDEVFNRFIAEGLQNMMKVQDYSSKLLNKRLKKYSLSKDDYHRIMSDFDIAEYFND